MDIMNGLPYLGQIASQGVLGIILAISLFANWYFINKIQDVNEKRVKDAQDFTDKLMEPINAIKSNSDLLVTLFTKFLGSNGNNK